MNEQNNLKKNRMTLLLVALLFCAPFAASWWFLNFTDIVEQGSKSNHGDLIIPPRPLPDLVLIDPLSDNRSGRLHGKWNLFYIARERCDQACKNNLYRMRQLRLTTGKDDLRIQRVLLVVQANHLIPAQTFAGYEGQWLVATDDIDVNELLTNFRLSESEHPASMQRIYIVDPLGNLMMSYPPDADPSGIIKDLKKLLKHSKIG